MKNRKILNLIWITACILALWSPLKLHAKQTGVIVVENHLTTDVGTLHVELFKVADVHSGQLQSVPAFANDPLTTQDLETATASEAKAKQYAVMIEDQKLQPTMQKEADQQGTALFDTVEEGIYLIRQVQDPNETVFQSIPFFVQMPMKNKDGVVDYHVVTQPKNTIDTPSGKRSVSVVKKWKDNNDQYHKRPETITVGLYENEKLLEQVSIGAINNWSWEWTDLKEQGVYRVAELQVPDSYKMSAVQHEDSFTITNQLVIHRDDIIHGIIDIITGDSTAVVRYIILFAASFGGIVLYLRHGRKHKIK